MNKFAFELVSPERVVFSGMVGSVILPATEGEMTVMANHTPIMSALKTGIITIDGDKQIFVRGGFIDVSTAGLTLLAEYAVAVEDVDKDKLKEDLLYV